METLSHWRIARAADGSKINVRLIPLKKRQSTVAKEFIWVEVGKQIELESGQQVSLNLDGHSFYVQQNQLYKLI